jgi:hypothetical protein
MLFQMRTCQVHHNLAQLGKSTTHGAYHAWTLLAMPHTDLTQGPLSALVLGNGCTRTSTRL